MQYTYTFYKLCIENAHVFPSRDPQEEKKQLKADALKTGKVYPWLLVIIPVFWLCSTLLTQSCPFW